MQPGTDACRSFFQSLSDTFGGVIPPHREGHFTALPSPWVAPTSWPKLAPYQLGRAKSRSPMGWGDPHTLEKIMGNSNKVSSLLAYLYTLTVFTSSMPPKRPNTRPARRASKMGCPSAQSSSRAQKKPAEAATAAVDDDHLQAAVKAALEGILPRIIHKVSTFKRKQVSQTRARSYTQSRGQAAHSSLAEADRPTALGMEAGDADPILPSSLAGRRPPPAQGAHDSMVGAQAQGVSP